MGTALLETSVVLAKTPETKKVALSPEVAYRSARATLAIELTNALRETHKFYVDSGKTTHASRLKNMAKSAQSLDFFQDIQNGRIVISRTTTSKGEIVRQIGLKSGRVSVQNAYASYLKAQETFVYAKYGKNGWNEDAYAAITNLISNDEMFFRSAIQGTFEKNIVERGLSATGASLSVLANKYAQLPRWQQTLLVSSVSAAIAAFVGGYALALAPIYIIIRIAGALGITLPVSYFGAKGIDFVTGWFGKRKIKKETKAYEGVYTVNAVAKAREIKIKHESRAREFARDIGLTLLVPLGIFFGFEIRDLAKGAVNFASSALDHAASSASLPAATSVGMGSAPVSEAVFPIYDYDGDSNYDGGAYHGLMGTQQVAFNGGFHGTAHVSSGGGNFRPAHTFQRPNAGTSGQGWGNRPSSTTWQRPNAGTSGQGWGNRPSSTTWQRPNTGTSGRGWSGKWDHKNGASPSSSENPNTIHSANGNNSSTGTKGWGSKWSQKTGSGSGTGNENPNGHTSHGSSGQSTGSQNPNITEGPKTSTGSFGPGNATLCPKPVPPGCERATLTHGHWVTKGPRVPMSNGSFSTGTFVLIEVDGHSDWQFDANYDQSSVDTTSVAQTTVDHSIDHVCPDSSQTTYQDQLHLGDVKNPHIIDDKNFGTAKAAPDGWTQAMDPSHRAETVMAARAGGMNPDLLSGLSAELDRLATLKVFAMEQLDPNMKGLFVTLSHGRAHGGGVEYRLTKMLQGFTDVFYAKDSTGALHRVTMVWIAKYGGGPGCGNWVLTGDEIVHTDTVPGDCVPDGSLNHGPVYSSVAEANDAQKSAAAELDHIPYTDTDNTTHFATGHDVLSIFKAVGEGKLTWKDVLENQDSPSDDPEIVAMAKALKEVAPKFDPNEKVVTTLERLGFH